MVGELQFHVQVVGEEWAWVPVGVEEILKGQ